MKVGEKRIVEAGKADYGRKKRLLTGSAVLAKGFDTGFTEIVKPSLKCLFPLDLCISFFRSNYISMLNFQSEKVRIFYFDVTMFTRNCLLNNR